MIQIQEWGESREQYLKRCYPDKEAVKNKLKELKPKKQHHKWYSQLGNVESRARYKSILRFEKELKALYD